MESRSLDEAEPFTTADGSTIRELHRLAVSSARAQSLAEATLAPGQATQRHYHALAEEIYVVLDGSGEMALEGERRRVEPGDAVLIPPRAWHTVRAFDVPLRFLCCCAPPYRHDDTFFS